MAHAVGIKILTRAEEIAQADFNTATSSEEKLPPYKQTHEAPPQSAGLAPINWDINSNYHKMIKSLVKQEPRYTDSELLRKALRNRKINARK